MSLADKIAMFNKKKDNDTNTNINVNTNNTIDNSKYADLHNKEKSQSLGIKKTEITNKLASINNKLNENQVKDCSKVTNSLFEKPEVKQIEKENLKKTENVENKSESNKEGNVANFLKKINSTQAKPTSLNTNFQNDINDIKSKDIKEVKEVKELKNPEVEKKVNFNISTTKSEDDNKNVEEIKKKPNIFMNDKFKMGMAQMLMKNNPMFEKRKDLDNKTEEKEDSENIIRSRSKTHNTVKSNKESKAIEDIFDFYSFKPISTNKKKIKKPTFEIGDEDLECDEN